MSRDARWKHLASAYIRQLNLLSELTSDVLTAGSPCSLPSHSCPGFSDAETQILVPSPSLTIQPSLSPSDSTPLLKHGVPPLLSCTSCLQFLP